MKEKIFEYKGYDIIDDGFGFQAKKKNNVAYYCETTRELIEEIDSEDDDLAIFETFFEE